MRVECEKNNKTSSVRVWRSRAAEYLCWTHAAAMATRDPTVLLLTPLSSRWNNEPTAYNKE